MNEMSDFALVRWQDYWSKTHYLVIFLEIEVNLLEKMLTDSYSKEKREIFIQSKQWYMQLDVLNINFYVRCIYGHQNQGIKTLQLATGLGNRW